MKLILNFLCVFYVLSFACQSYADEKTDNSRLFFRENKGQIFDQNNDPRSNILFSGSSDDLSYFFRQDGISYQLYLPTNNDAILVSRVDVTWVGANSNAKIVTDNNARFTDNFYNAPNGKGITNVKSFGDLLYENIYSGINLHYYYKGASLKYDFIVAPGAEYKNIQIKIDGATTIRKEKDGTISIATPSGIMTEGLPVAYQANRKIKTSWVLKGNTLSFIIADYDPSLPLTIDPLVYKWEKLVSTCGTSNLKPIWYTHTANDDYGNTYATSYKNYPAGPSNDWYFSKYSNNGSPVWEQIISGGGANLGCIPYGCSVNGNSIYVCGYAKISNIATAGAYQTTISGGKDCLIIKYDSSGAKIWASYYGGTGDDIAKSCKADALGNVYICGSTTSSNNISFNAYQSLYGGGTGDAFVAKFNTSGALKWGTYFGGTGLDDGKSVDANNNKIFIGGSTRSASGIASSGAQQSVLSGYQAGFLLCLDTAGAHQWSTYYGGDTTYIGECVADNSNVYLCGTTSAINNIATSTTFQPSIGGGSDGFLVKFNTNGVRQWGTYYGGLNNETGLGCALSNNGKIYICGNTKSSLGIATPWSYNPNYFVNSGITTGVAYLAELDTLGQRISGSYCNNRIDAQFCSTNSLGEVFIGGESYKTFSGPPNDICYLTYVEKFSYCNDPSPSVSATATSICSNNPVQISTPSISGFTYQWYRNDTIITGATGNLYSTAIAGVYKVQVNNCPSAISSPITINTVNAPAVLITKTDAACATGATGNISVAVSGGSPPYTYVWNNSSNTTSSLTGLLPGVYVVSASDVNLCGEVDTITILNSNNNPTTQITVDNVPCYGAPIGSITVIASGGTPPYNYTWDNSLNITSSLSGLLPGNYIVHVIDANTCVKVDSVTVLQDTTISPSDPLASICAVTVDPVTDKNLIIWEKNGTVNAKAYNVYRESSVAGQYDLVGTKAVDEFSTILDNTSMPLQQSYSYKIAELDSCDHEWPLSDLHKTIHLSSSVGINGEVNLSWNPYEGKPYSTHDIMRSFNGGPFTLLNEVSSTITSYSDLTPPTGTLVYRIEIDLGTLCAPAKPTTEQRVASNTITLSPTGVNNIVSAASMQIIPNPTTGSLHILGDKPEQIMLYDAMGRLLMEQKNVSKIDISNYSKGLYLIRLLNKSGVIYYSQKVILK